MPSILKRQSSKWCPFLGNEAINNFPLQALLGEVEQPADEGHSAWAYTRCVFIMWQRVKMVEFQRTLSFNEHILPLLLKEREKYSGSLTEDGYGITVSVT